MLQMAWPIAMVVCANVFYNITAKQTPDDINPLFSLGITYAVSMVICFILFFVTSPDNSLTAQVAKMNWTTFVFGLTIIGLEFGYLNIYRVGWQMSTVTLVANVSLAIILVFVGALLYKEVITPRQIAGVGVCAVGLFLLMK